MGPGFLSVPAQIVAQIMEGKYVDLSNLLVANLQLQQKDSEQKLLLNGHLVRISQ